MRLLAGRNGLRLRAAPDQMIERKGARSAGDDEQQKREPENVLGPAIGIDEELNDQGHDHEAERRQPRGKPDHEQHRQDVLAMVAA